MGKPVFTNEVIDKFNSILKTQNKPIDKLDLWIDYLKQLGMFLFDPSKKPHEYYTFDYNGILKVVTDPQLLLYFKGKNYTPGKFDEEYFEMQKKYFYFMQCDVIKKGEPFPQREYDSKGIPLKKCGFAWEFWYSGRKYKNYLKKLEEDRERYGEGSKKKSRRKKSRRKKSNNFI